MDEIGDAQARTWLAMDLLAPVHELRALDAAPGPDGEAPPAVQALTDGLLGEHHPVLTEAALAGRLDLERVLVLGATLDAVRALGEPGLVAAVEDVLVDEACRLPLLSLVNAATDLLVGLGREGAERVEAHDGAEPADESAVDAAGRTARPLGPVAAADPPGVWGRAEPWTAEEASPAVHRRVVRRREPRWRGRGVDARRVHTTGSPAGRARVVLGPASRRRSATPRGPPRRRITTIGECRARECRPGGGEAAHGRQGPSSQSSR